MSKIFNRIEHKYAIKVSLFYSSCGNVLPGMWVKLSMTVFKSSVLFKFLQFTPTKVIKMYSNLKTCHKNSRFLLWEKCKLLKWVFIFYFIFLPTTRQLKAGEFTTISKYNMPTERRPSLHSSVSKIHLCFPFFFQQNLKRNLILRLYRKQHAAIVSRLACH